MEVLLRASGTALCACFAALLLRRSMPELTLGLSTAAVAVVLIASVGLFRGINDLSEAMSGRYGLETAYVLPLIKCLAIALITKLSAELCRDSAQNAMASAVELTGTACALGVVLPLIFAVLDTIGGLL